MLMSSHTMYDGIELHSKVASRDSKVTLIHALYPAARGSLTRDGAALKPALLCPEPDSNLAVRLCASGSVRVSAGAADPHPAPGAPAAHAFTYVPPARVGHALGGAARHGFWDVFDS